MTFTTPEVSFTLPGWLLPPAAACLYLLAGAAVAGLLVRFGRGKCQRDDVLFLTFCWPLVLSVLPAMLLLLFVVCKVFLVVLVEEEKVP